MTVWEKMYVIWEESVKKFYFFLLFILFRNVSFFIYKNEERLRKDIDVIFILSEVCNLKSNGI